MPIHGGIVDSYARYIPIEARTPATTPGYDRIGTEGTEWCFVDEVVEDGAVWSPSTCISDGDVTADDAEHAERILLERHAFKWPSEIDGWKLISVRHDVVLDS